LMIARLRFDRPWLLPVPVTAAAVGLYATSTAALGICFLQVSDLCTAVLGAVPARSPRAFRLWAPDLDDVSRRSCTPAVSCVTAAVVVNTEAVGRQSPVVALAVVVVVVAVVVVVVAVVVVVVIYVTSRGTRYFPGKHYNSWYHQLQLVKVYE